MKKVIITALVALLVGGLGVNYVVQGKESTGDHVYEIEEQTDDTKATYEELSVIEDEIDLKGLSMDVVEDNDHTRVILFEKENGKVKYKSIYKKENSYLKLVDVQNGVIFDGLLDGENEKEASVEKEAAPKADKQLREYAIVQEHIDMDHYKGSVVEDNKNKRIVLYADENGQDQYKTIYMKKKNNVKVIDFDKGLIFEGKVKADKQAKTKKDATKNTKETKKAEKKQTSVDNSTISNYDEYSKIAEHIDTKQYEGKVVEDNKGKRVIVFQDTNGKKQYKSIYVKQKGFVKIIDFQGGMIYKGQK